MISLLIPVTDVDEAITCMIEAEKKCLNIDRVNFVLRFNSADVDNLSRISEIPEYSLCICSGDSKNRADEVNEMCAVACGEYLMYWHQEWRFETRMWEQHLQGISMGCTATGHCFINRDIYRLLGHYSLHENVNQYVFTVGQLSGLLGQNKVVTSGETKTGGFDGEANKICLDRDVQLIRSEIEKTTPLSTGT